MQNDLDSGFQGDENLSRPSTSTGGHKRVNDETIQIFDEGIRKRFRQEQPESSADSLTSDDSHIVGFEPFLNHPMALESEFSIDPEKWALAFLQPDIGSITKVLSQALFTGKDLERRTQRRDTDNPLPIEKTIAIKRLAKWMTNKRQDPWTYSPKPYPNNEEKKEIENIFMSFKGVEKRRSSYDEKAVDETIENPSNGPCDHNHDFKVRLKLQQIQNEKPISPAHFVKQYTKIVVPQNNDVFVDAVQFSRGRWGKAFDILDDISASAVVLFRADLKRSKKPLTTFNEYCPVKKLAIIRAIAWMKNKDKAGDIYDFNPAIPEHNLFLSQREIELIGNAIDIVIKRHNMQNSFHEVEAGNTQNSLPSRMENMCLENAPNSEVQFAIVYENQLQIPNTEISRNITLENGNIQNKCEQVGVVPSTATSGHVDEPLGPYYDDVCENFTQDIGQETYDHMLRDLDHLDHVDDTTVVSNEAGHSVDNLASTKILQNNYNLYPIFNKNGAVISPGSRVNPIPMDVWGKAYEIIKGDEDVKNKSEAGKYLLPYVFDIEELKNNTLTGKAGKDRHYGKLDEEKVKTIFDAISILKAMKTNPTEEGAFKEKAVQLTQWPPLNSDTYKIFSKDVFTDGRNYSIKKHNQREKASTNTSSNSTRNNNDEST